MSALRNFATVALASMLAVPLSAQVVLDPGTVRDRVEAARRRAENARTTESARDRIEDARRRAESARSRAEARRRVEGQADVRRDGRGHSKVPRGHLPPKGMCRVWIDGVPPGQQPPVTDCVTAELNRTANSRVIYGDRESFPGKGKGKFKNGDSDRDDDDRWDDDNDRNAGMKLSKSEKDARKEARKGGRGRGK